MLRTGKNNKRRDEWTGTIKRRRKAGGGGEGGGAWTAEEKKKGSARFLYSFATRIGSRDGDLDTDLLGADVLLGLLALGYDMPRVPHSRNRAHQPLFLFPPRKTLNLSFRRHPVPARVYETLCEV